MAARTGIHSGVCERLLVLVKGVAREFLHVSVRFLNFVRVWVIKFMASLADKLKHGQYISIFYHYQSRIWVILKQILQYFWLIKAAFAEILMN